MSNRRLQPRAQSPALTPGEVCELTIDKIGYGGVGIAKHPSGLICLVGKTLPGERVRAQVVQIKRRHAVLKLDQVIQPSPKRIAPVCNKFSECGGCHLQELSYADQLDVKLDVLKENFSRAASPILTIPDKLVPAVPELNYRNKNFFHCRNGKLGFMSSTTHDLIAIDTCPCAPPATNDCLEKLQTWLDQQNASVQTSISDCLIRQSESTGEMMVIVVSDTEAVANDVSKLNEVIKNVSLHLNLKPRGAKYSLGERFIHLFGPEFLRERIGPYSLRLSPGSFVQIHPTQAANLYQRVVSELDLKKDQPVLDLYAGSGALAFYLTSQAESVYAVELMRQAVLDAEASANLNRVSNITFRTGKCETIVARLKRDGKQFSVATLNPPRAGCASSVLALLPELGVEKIAYISCSPPTLKRDIAVLQGLNYRLDRLIPFDMFPQTYHLEVLAIFKNY